MDTQIATPDVDALVAAGSFARFVFPFTTKAATSGGEGHEVPFVDRLETAAWGETRLWQPDPINKDHDLRDLVQHFRRDSVARWRLTEAALRDWLGFGERRWEMQAQGKATIAWTLTAIQLWWFEDDVGFLTFEAAPVTADPDTWLTFLHHFRFTGGSQRRKTWPSDGEAPAWMNGQEKTTLWSLVDTLMHTLGLGKDEPARWQALTDAWQMFPFAALLVDGLPDTERPLFRHRFRQSFRANQADNAAPEDLEARGHRGFLAYADQQWFTFSMNGGGFLAFDAPEDEFNRTTLPKHVRNRYWFVLMLVLHQRYALTLFSRQTARYWEGQLEATGRAGATGAAVTFAQMEGVYRRLLTFTAHGYFTQVVQLDHYHRFYRRWVETLQIQAFYDEVRDEVAEMRAWLDLVLTRQNVEREKAESAAAQGRADEEARIARATEEQAQRLERRLNLFAVILGFPALVLTAAAATGELSRGWVVAWTVIGLAVGLAVLGLLRLIDRKDDKIPPEPISPDVMPPNA